MVYEVKSIKPAESAQKAAEPQPNSLFFRQLGIYNPQAYPNARAVVLGAGGLGSPTVLALAKMGVQNIEVWDDDVVESHNQPNQMYGAGHVGERKVGALGRIASELAGSTIATMAWRLDAETKADFIEGITPFTVVIATPDSMAARKLCWEAVKESTALGYVDLRMAGEYIEAFNIKPSDREHRRYYESRLPDDASVPDAPCTARATIYAGFQAAAWASSAFKAFQVGNPLPLNVAFDFANYTFVKRGVVVHDDDE